MCPPLLQAPPKPSHCASSAPDREDTPWPGTGKMSGNLFEDRNWLLPKDYLVTENKKEDTTIDTAKPPQLQKPLPKPQARRPDTLSLIKMRQQWEAEMERLNSKYNLDFFSDSELDSESGEGKQYQYEHGYKTLI